jgi:hypothetical protein
MPHLLEIFNKNHRGTSVALHLAQSSRALDFTTKSQPHHPLALEIRTVLLQTTCSENETSHCATKKKEPMCV